MSSAPFFFEATIIRVSDWCNDMCLYHAIQHVNLLILLEHIGVHVVLKKHHLLDECGIFPPICLLPG